MSGQGSSSKKEWPIEEVTLDDLNDMVKLVDGFAEIAKKDDMEEELKKGKKFTFAKKVVDDKFVDEDGVTRKKLIGFIFWVNKLEEGCWG